MRNMGKEAEMYAFFCRQEEYNSMDNRMSPDVVFCKASWITESFPSLPVTVAVGVFIGPRHFTGGIINMCGNMLGTLGAKFSSQIY